MVCKQKREAMRAPNRLPPRRSGLTLTELLVVIAVLVAVTSVLAPLITPSLEGREIREAARQINAYMQQAQAKARELGRPVGVVIQRSEFIGDPAELTNPNSNVLQDPNTLARLDFGYQLSLAEEPPPFKGFFPTDRARVSGNLAFLELTGGAAGGIDPAVLKLIQENDHIRFNLRGSRYRILHVGGLTAAQKDLYPAASLRVRFELTDGDLQSYAASQAAVPFEVFRRPRQTASTPLELPTGTAIIMDLSGVGMDYAAGAQAGIANSGEETQVATVLNPRQKYIGLTEFKRPATAEMLTADPTGSFLNHPLTIMFAPDGSVERIYRVLPPMGVAADANYPPKRPQDKIFLFVGKDAISTWDNYRDTSNLWIAIDPTNGLVNTAAHTVPLTVQKSPPATFDVLPMQTKLAHIANSRQIAATGQSMGGQ